MPVKSPFRKLTYNSGLSLLLPWLDRLDLGRCTEKY